jgi:aspartyl protease family protein
MAYRDELEAALARAEAAERLLRSVCYVHADAPAASVCGRCDRRLCEACTVETLEGTRCAACAARVPTRRYGPWIVAGGIGAVVMAGLVAVLAIGGRRSADGPLAEPATGGVRKTTYWAEAARDTLAKEPCSRPAAATLAKELNRLGNHAGNLAFTADFQARCGAYTYLLWTNVYAHEQRGEWSDAATVATALIAGDPTDADFWWWRGNDVAHLGELDQAAADYSQSLARRASLDVAWRLAETADKLGRTCDSAFALEYALAGHDLDDDTEARERWRNAYMSGGCSAFDGAGTDVLRLRPNAPALTARASIEGTVIATVVDERTAQVVVTAAVAERAHLVRRPGTVRIWAMGRFYDAQLAVAREMTVERTRAAFVPIAVVADLPPGVDGIVGLTYLWRFAFDRHGDALALSPLPR